MNDFFINQQFILQLITAAAVGLTGGYIGSFMVLRRMALVGDALSHVALPGVALALLYGFSPLLGGFAALFIAIVIIWTLENKTRLNVEALVGLLFTVALAVGLLITPEEEILHALIGDIADVSASDTVIALLSSVVVICVMDLIVNKFVLSTLSEDLARANKISVASINFIFLLLVAVVVAIGIKVTGTLLMGALVIIPALASKNMTISLKNYVMGSALIGLVTSALGIIASHLLGLPPGPVIVMVGGIAFVCSLFASRQ